MQKPEFDPGLTQQFDAPLRRAVNKDGSFNVRRSGVGWRAFHPWVYVVNMSWPGFMGMVLALYSGINVFFALVYFAMAPGEIAGSEATTATGRFLDDFFFSAHTITTVGYGSLAPHGLLANVVSSTEALSGLMLFAVLTGFLVARVSRPSARIGYSPQAVIAPYQNGSALMFRVANERNNNLMEISAQVMLMRVVSKNGRLERRFDLLPLEREKVLFLPITWTVVHPIDETSPLYGRTAEEMRQAEAEILILLKAFDDSFGQTVHSRYSYRFDEVVWGAKFKPAFRVDPKGNLHLHLDRLGDMHDAPLELSAPNEKVD